MKVISRSEACAKGLPRYFTGRPCKYGHVGLRLASSGNCEECTRAYMKLYMSPYMKEYNLLPKQKEAVRSYHKRPEWKAYRSMYHRKRRQHIDSRATPSWADKNKIADVYSLAYRLTQETGTPYEVDHIVPLRGRLVSGLHVHYNLRAIPKSVNQTKHNQTEN